MRCFAVRDERCFGEQIKYDGDGHWYECACGEKSGVEEHSWKPKTEIIEEADCINGGERVVTCSVCGLVTNQETPPLGHDFSIGHTDGGLHYHNCSRCDATDNGENIEYELYVENYREVWFIGQVFELTGASASVKCVACGEETAVDIQEVVTDGGAFEEACEKKTVVCTYGEYTFTVVVTVKEKTLESVAVATGDDTENKYDYAIGEEFAGGKLTLSFDDGSVEYADLTADMLDDFSTSAIGVYTVYVDYEDKLCSFEIRVGFDKEAGAYKLGTEKGIFKVQVEDENYVDMSGAVLQTGAAVCVMMAVVITCGGVFAPVSQSGGTETYTFEAEYVYLDDFMGAGISNSGEGVNNIYGEGSDEDKAKGWSNGYFLGNTYAVNSITFEITSDRNAEGKLILRLASELGALALNNEVFGIAVNGKEVDYSFTVANSAAGSYDFADYPVAAEINLAEGVNEITLSIKENTLKDGNGIGAPLIDCIKITTEAGLSWNPLTDNPDNRGKI